MLTDNTMLTVLPDERSPRCWGSLITGSLDFCAPEFAPGARRKHNLGSCPPGPPQPPWLARRRFVQPTTNPQVLPI